MARIFLPSFSFAISSIALKAQPEEMPHKRPSALARTSFPKKASSSLTVKTLSINSKSRFLGIKFAPIPCILWFEALPSVIRGLLFGSTPIILVLGEFSFKYLALPEIVPPVPIVETKKSRVLPKSENISLPVVS